MKKTVMGILAHVDAGKTTLSEAILYVTGATRTLGRVDHGDAFLDTDGLEKARGITIFAKQANFQWKDLRVSLLDTPGHVDFSAEMERTLSVLDYAVLVISGSEGVQGHTRTLWQLLQEYGVPVFLFVNKMDLAQREKEELLEELTGELSEGIVDFSRPFDDPDFQESLACCQEELLEEFLEKGKLERERVVEAIIDRRTFPCFFGSALRLEGVEQFLDGLAAYVRTPSYPETFGARVFKVSHNEGEGRITHVKITGGSLRVKEPFPAGGGRMAKADQIRVYHGAKYELVQEAKAGMICALTGLEDSRCGQGFGFEEDGADPVIESVLTYRVVPVTDVPLPVFLEKLRRLEEEEPQLSVTWKEAISEIQVHVMGEIQIEILKSVILDRFGWEVEFQEGGVLYKETIASPVEGVGHFEPLRHYAEVHLLLEPLPKGSGLEFLSQVSEDFLDKNWQRLILTHLREKEHLGVLTGSPLTDVRITLIQGKAHLKHTEGGDFRQATYRAVRNGLMRASSLLLEPYYAIRVEAPAENVGRVLSDVQNMGGSFEPPEIRGENVTVRGRVPAASFFGYPLTVSAFTRGKGRVFSRFDGYEPCHDQEAVVERMGYDPDLDLENPSGSVFCTHGAGFPVAWDEVEKYMHLPFLKEKTQPMPAVRSAPAVTRKEPKGAYEQDKELEEIFRRTFGEIKRKRSSYSSFGREKRNESKVEGQASRPKKQKSGGRKEEFLLVDGYNVIFAWDELRELSRMDLGGARDALMDLLSNYQGYRRVNVILVFDAYKVKGNPGEVLRHNGIDVVYTREAETADMYIEKTSHRLSKENYVRVATSDGMEQMIIVGQGAIRMSARELKQEIEDVQRQIREDCGEDGGLVYRLEKIIKT